MSTEHDETEETGIVGSVLDYAVNVINNADPAIAQDIVAKLRKDNPERSIDELADILIKRKCYSTGAVGAISSSISIIPGVGSVVAMTFGAAADISMTFKQQAELVMEIAALYGHQLTPSERRSAILLVTGIGAGSQHLATKGGEQIAQKATEQLAAQTIAKAIPFIGVGVSAGSNILATYVIGQRAKAYFNPESEELEEIETSLEAISDADETTIAGWLTEATENSYQMVSQTTQDMLGGVIVAGQKSGELVVIGASQTGQSVTALVGTLGSAASSAQRFVFDTTSKVGKVVSATGQSVWDAGKATGEVVSSAGESVVGIGTSAAGSVAVGAGDAAGKVVESISSVSSSLTWGTSTDEESTDAESTDEDIIGKGELEKNSEDSDDTLSGSIADSVGDAAGKVVESIGNVSSLLTWGKREDEEDVEELENTDKL